MKSTKLSFESLYEGFRRSNDAMFYTDRKGAILEINAAFTRVYGWTPEEAVGRTPRLMRSRHSTKELYERMWSRILDPKIGYWRGEIINRTKDGHEVPVLLTITSVHGEGGDIVGYVSNALDLSEQMSMQARLAQAEALANIGEMAAVVAHEIRNPLGSIVMAAKQLASGRLAKGDKETVLQVLKDESQRLNGVLSNLLAYARPRELKHGRGALNAIVEEVCGMVRSNGDLLGEADLAVTLSPEVHPFPMDSDQMRQVVWNILINALQALDGKGRLSVETGREGQRAFVRIADTGPGIPEADLSDIFKPFHTTKRQGTGLGLAIADRIVKAHGGTIEVASRPSEGAAFTVYLPAVEG